MERTRGREVRPRGVRALRVALFAGVVLLLGSALSPLAGAGEPVATGWVLEIVAKELDPETRELRVRVRNAGEGESVTAFGVVMVHDRGDGRGGSRQVQAREMLPGTALAPGDVVDLSFKVGAADQGPASRFAAVQVAPHFEILSDTTSRGDTAAVEEVFARRALALVEAQNALARLQQARADSRDADSPADFWADFWHSESERLSEASRFVGIVNTSLEARPEIGRQQAIYTYAELFRQFERRVAAGTLALEEALDEMEWALEEGYIEPYSAGVRPGDLERGPADDGARR